MKNLQGKSRIAACAVLPIILALVALCTALGPGTVRGASHPISAANLYFRAYRTLDHASRFDIVTRITYLRNRKRSFSSDLRFIAPYCTIQSSDLGGGLGTSWQVHVNNSFCSWNAGPTFRRIFCQRLSWGHSAVSLEVDNHPAEIHLAHAHFSFGRSTGTVRRIKVTGRAGLGCPGMSCPPMAGTLVVVLTVDVHRLIPVSFSAVIANRTPDERLSIVYRYGHRFKVVLPHRTRVSCAAHAPRHGWCLSQR